MYNKITKLIDSSEIYCISGGCSYTLECNFKNDVPTHHIGSPSAGMGYIRDSVISHISYLLKNNIPSKNIIAFINITQIGRISIKYPDYIWYSIKDYHDILYERNYLGNKFKYYKNGLCSFDNQVYGFMNQTDNELNKYPKFVREWYLNQIKAHETLDVNTHIKNYIEDIVLLQTFLKLNNIEYYFYFMNNTFEGWYYDTDNILKHKYSSHIEYELPNLKSYLNISEIDNNIKSIYDLLDFEKMLLHTNDKQTFGGLDEYCNDNYPKESFKDYKTNTKSECIIGLHPNREATETFAKKYLYPKWIHFYNNIKNEEV